MTNINILKEKNRNFKLIVRYSNMSFHKALFANSERIQRNKLNLSAYRTKHECMCMYVVTNRHSSDFKTLYLPWCTPCFKSREISNGRGKR